MGWAAAVGEIRRPFSGANLVSFSLLVQTSVAAVLVIISASLPTHRAEQGSPAGWTAGGDVTVVVTGLDYAFQAPDTLAAGATMFTLDNRGLVHHSFGLFLLKDGKSAADFMRAATAQERAATFEEAVGGFGAFPGRMSSGRLATDLLRGRTYLIVCQDRDAVDKPPHMQLGMVRSFYVK
jgi:hypothetical protein